MCRFINADEVNNLASNGDYVSLNLYAYCGNTPVARKDDGGAFWHIVIGAAVGGLIGGISTALTGGDATDIFIGVAAGMAGGALTASGAGVVIQALGSAGISMAANASQQVNDIVKDKTGQESFDVFDMLFDGAVGLTCGIIGGNGASYGNTKSIWNSGKNFTKKLFSGSGKQAWAYYAKTAHRAGGDFVLDALSSSLKVSTAGTGVITVKNLIMENS